MKRAIVLLLCLALALSLFAGCRAYMPFPRLPGEDPTTEPTAETEPATTEAPRPLTAEEIHQAALDRLRTADTLAADLRIDLGLTIEEDDSEVTKVMRMEFSGELMTWPLAFHGSGSISADDEQAQYEDIPFELYLFAEDEATVLYGRSNEDETFGRVTLSLPEEKSLSESSAPSILWDLETGEERYALSHTVTAEEAERFWAARKDGLEDLETLEELGVDPDCFRDLLTGTKLGLTVDRETLELREASADLSEGFGGFLRELLEKLMISIAGEDGEAVSLDRLKGASLVFALKLHDYDEITPFEAPEDWEDRGDLSELLDGLGGDPELGPVLEELDDSYGLEDYAFRLSEITPRDIVDRGWVVTDAISMDGELTEDGSAGPGALVQLYLKQEGHEEDTWNPLRLGVVNDGEEAADPLDCPICFFSVNEVMFYEQSEAGMVDFSGPGGIHVDMDQDQITALLGKPYFESEGSESPIKCIYYYTTRGEALALLMDQNGLLKALFYQDYARYDPSDYVFHD